MKSIKVKIEGLSPLLMNKRPMAWHTNFGKLSPGLLVEEPSREEIGRR